MSDRATRQLARRGLPWDHPEVLADLTRRGLIPAAHVDLASDVASWRDWPEGALSDRAWRLFACDCAGRALSRVESPDPRSVDAVRVARRYAEGRATRAELAAAEVAAWGAARYAARDAAWAAREAAWVAARATARDAAWAAAWSAARDAARDAAEDAEQAWQDRHMRCCLLSPEWPDWKETR